MTLRETVGLNLLGDRLGNLKGGLLSFRVGGGFLGLLSSHGGHQLSDVCGHGVYTPLVIKLAYCAGSGDDTGWHISRAAVLKLTSK
jgi:hypothetical protein